MAVFAGGGRFHSGSVPRCLAGKGIYGCFSTEEFVSARRCGRIKINSRFRRRCGNRKLIEMKRRKFFRNAIVVGRNVRQVGETIRGGNREFRGVVQSWIEEPAHTVHFQRRDKRVPVSDGAPRSRPRVLIETSETVGVWNQSRSRNVRARH